MDYCSRVTRFNMCSTVNMLICFSAAAVIWRWTVLCCNLCCYEWIRSVQLWASSVDEGRSSEEAGDLHWHACSREWCSHHTACSSHRGELQSHTHTALQNTHRTDLWGAIIGPIRGCLVKYDSFHECTAQVEILQCSVWESCESRRLYVHPE